MYQKMRRLRKLESANRSLGIFVVVLSWKEWEELKPYYDELKRNQSPYLHFALQNGREVVLNRSTKVIVIKARNEPPLKTDLS